MDTASLGDPQEVITQTLMPKTKKKPPCNPMRKKMPWTDGALLSEYQKEYWEKRAPHERVGLTVPRTNLGPGGPFDGTTSYGTSYKAPDGAGPAQGFKPPVSEKENLPFSPWTTYKVDYPAKDVPYQRVRPAQRLNPSEGPFEDTTTMKTSYPGWTGARPPTPAQARSVSVPRGVGPFEGLSAYKDDYRRWPTARAAPVAPILGQNAALPGGAFNDATTHRAVYTPKNAPPPERVRHEDQTLRPEGWFDGPPSTEYRQHYIGKEGGPQARAGATVGASGAALPKGPFFATTTYGTEFRPRTAPDYVRVGRPQDDPRDSGPFAGQTTYGDTFTKKDVPYARVKPTQRLNPSEGPFEDSTENKEKFKNWGTQPIFRAGPSVSGNLASVGPFDGATTYRTDYHKLAGGLRAAYVGRPLSGTRALKPPGPFVGTTEYTTCYTPKKADPVESYKPAEDCCEDDC